MKFKRFLLLLVFAAFPTFAYQQEGFSQYQVLDGNMNFTCTGQCIASIGPLAGKDSISLNGSVQGNWMIWYGFIVGQQIILGDTIQINRQTTIHQQFLFTKLPFYSQIPAWSQVVFIVQGTIIWNQFGLEIWAMNFYQKIWQWWKDFRIFDTFKPYTINLLHWPMVWGKNANNIFYILFILFIIGILVFIKWPKKKLLYMLLWWFSLRIIYDVRMWLEMMNYYKYDYQTYISQSWYQKTYRDRGDFYSFVDFTTDTLSKLWLPKFEVISFYTDNAWPFPGSMKYFLYPYDVQVNSGQNNYFVVYGYQNVIRTTSTLMLSGVDLWSWTFYEFSSTAFIFVK